MTIVWILSYFAVFLMGLISFVPLLTLAKYCDDRKKAKLVKAPPNPEDFADPQLPVPGSILEY